MGTRQRDSHHLKRHSAADVFVVGEEQLLDAAHLGVPTDPVPPSESCVSGVPEAAAGAISTSGSGEASALSPETTQGTEAPRQAQRLSSSVEPEAVERPRDGAAQGGRSAGEAHGRASQQRLAAALATVAISGAAATVAALVLYGAGERSSPVGSEGSGSERVFAHREPARRAPTRTPDPKRKGPSSRTAAPATGLQASAPLQADADAVIAVPAPAPLPAARASIPQPRQKPEPMEPSEEPVEAASRAAVQREFGP
jgi:hypothetical protein